MNLERVAAMLAVVGTGMLLGGCSLISQNRPEPDAALPTTPPPEASVVVQKHNARVAGLARIWSRTHVRLRGTDGEGQAFDETTEGHLLIELPRKLALRVTRLGEVYFVLGSNDEKYWWLDLATKPPTAQVGSHALASREAVRKFGLPVQPEDLMEVLAITPITLPEGVSTRWVTSREVELVLPQREGSRAVRFSAETMEPTGVELRDESGRVVISAALSDFEQTGVGEGVGIGPRFQKRTDITVPGIEGLGRPGTPVRVTIDHYGVENRAINQENFNVEALLARYRVTTVRSLDGQPAGTVR